MAIASAQTPVQARTAGSGTTQAVNYGSNVTAGNSLIALATHGSNTTCTFSGGGTWASTVVTFWDSIVGQLLSIGYCKTATGGSTTGPTATFGSAGPFSAILAFEFSGIDQTTPLDTNTAGRDLGTTGATLTDASMTTAIDGELVISCCILNGSSTITAGSGFTLGPVDTSDFFGSVYQIQTTHGSIAAVYNLSPNQGGGTVSAAFKPAVAGGSTPGALVVPGLAAIQAANF